MYAKRLKKNRYNIDSIVISLKKLYIISACVVTLVLTQHDYYMVCITIWAVLCCAGPYLQVLDVFRGAELRKASSSHESKEVHKQDSIPAQYLIGLLTAVPKPEREGERERERERDIKTYFLSLHLHGKQLSRVPLSNSTTCSKAWKN